MLLSGAPCDACRSRCCNTRVVNEMPRTVPSAYGQTAGGSRSSRKRDLSGSADAAVRTPRTIEPLLGGKTYFNPWDRNSISPDRLTLFSGPAMYSKSASTQRFRAFDTSDGEMLRLSAGSLDGSRGPWRSAVVKAAKHKPLNL
jgi:hypothetical protein